jgi:sRNA-binding regulator protein Hfq
MKSIVSAVLIFLLALVAGLVLQTSKYRKIASSETRVQIVLRNGRVLNAQALSFAPHAVAVFVDGGVRLVDAKQISRVGLAE